MSTTMKASVHLGPSYNEKLVPYRNTNFEELKTLFDISQRLILENAHEILNVSTIEWDFPSWMRSTLLHDKVIKWAKAKVHVYPDSVLCLGNMHDHSEANAKWRDQIEDFRQSNAHREIFGIDGNQSSSSGIFSHDLQRWRIFKRSQFYKSIQNNLRKNRLHVFRIPRKSRTTQKGFRARMERT